MQEMTSDDLRTAPRTGRSRSPTTTEEVGLRRQVTQSQAVAVEMDVGMTALGEALQKSLLRVTSLRHIEVARRHHPG